MPIAEIPQSGYAYRVQPLDKDQASQQEQYRREKKKDSEDKAKKPDSIPSATKGKGGKCRINLIV